jgi:predicted transcriptional regulator
MSTKNLARLAKGNKKPIVQEKTVTKTVEKPKTPEEERDMKAKQKVEELLQGVEFTPKKEEPVETVVAKSGKEWLEEQVTLLSEQTEKLRIELAQSKEDYTKLYGEYQAKRGTSKDLLNETLVQNVLIMFNELQSNFTGVNQERVAHDIVKIEYLLKQMLLLFPFTEQYRRF